MVCPHTAAAFHLFKGFFDFAEAQPHSELFAWSFLGRPLTFMLLEAKLFSVLVLLADQYKRTQSLPMPAIVHSAYESLMRMTGFRKPAYSKVDSTEAPHGVLDSNHSVEMTQQAEFQVGLPSRTLHMSLQLPSPRNCSAC